MAQLDNAADSDSEDRGFESLRAGQEISRLTEAGNFFLKRRDSKDERDRATVRWTVATASDQAPAGARIAIPSSGPRNFSPHRGGGFLFKTKGFEGRAVEKSTSEEVLFSLKRTLRRMKNEAGLRPMKRGCAARKDAGASLHASAASASQKPSGFCFTFAAGKRFIAV